MKLKKKLLAAAYKLYLKLKQANGTYEYSDEYYMTKCILIVMDMYWTYVERGAKIMKEIDSLMSEYKIELEKDYSERKYEIRERLDVLIKIYSKYRNYFIEKASWKYYEVTGNELLSDVDHVLSNFLNHNGENSVRDYVSILKSILDNSDLNKQMSSLLKEKKVMKLYPLLEAVIRPLDFEEPLEILSGKSKIESLEEIEEIFDNKVKFVTFNEYKKMNPESRLPPNAESVISSFGGLGIGSVLNNKIIFICNPKLLLTNLNNWNKPSIIQNLKKILNHESIHVQQIERSGNKLKDVDQIDDMGKSYNNYLANKQEIMAYARTIVDEFTQFGLSPEEIKRRIRTNNYLTPTAQQYFSRFDNGSPVIKLLKKYIYLYLEQLS